MSFDQTPKTNPAAVSLIIPEYRELSYLNIKP